MRERRIDYKTKGARIPLYRRNSREKLSERQREILKEIRKLEYELDRIKGKEFHGFKLRPKEIKAKEELLKRIEVLKGQFYSRKRGDKHG